MSAGFMYSANTAPQTIDVGRTINVGNNIRRCGCVKDSATPYASANGLTTTLSSCGKCPTYFDISATVVITPTAAGSVTVTALQDGVEIPGATASATVAAAATTVTLPLAFGVRLNTGVTSSNITYVLTGAAGTVTNVSQKIMKV